jgi:hypothetical protein
LRLTRIGQTAERTMTRQDVVGSSGLIDRRIVLVAVKTATRRLPAVACGQS